MSRPLAQFSLKLLFAVVTGVSLSLAFFVWLGAPAIPLCVQIAVCWTLLAQTTGEVWRGVLIGFAPMALLFYTFGAAYNAGPLQFGDWRILVLSAVAGTYGGWIGAGIHAMIIRHRSGPIAFFLALAWLPFSCCFGALTDDPGALHVPMARQKFPAR